MSGKIKRRFTLKRMLIVLGALFLSISIGSEVKSAVAGQDIQSLLTNWFTMKKMDAVEQIDLAITAEKELLLADLKIALQEEMHRVERELEEFKNAEIKKRTEALREYADGLKANINTNLSDQKDAISADLDAIFEQDILDLEGEITSTQPVLTPEQETDVIPDLIPEPELGQELEPDDLEQVPGMGQTPEPELDNEEKQDHTPVTDPESEFRSEKEPDSVFTPVPDERIE